MRAKYPSVGALMRENEARLQNVACPSCSSASTPTSTKAEGRTAPPPVGMAPPSGGPIPTGCGSIRPSKAQAGHGVVDAERREEKGGGTEQRQRNEAGVTLLGFYPQTQAGHSVQCEAFYSDGMHHHSRAVSAGPSLHFFFFFTVVAGPRRSLSLKLSDTRVYEPTTRARSAQVRAFNFFFFITLEPRVE